MANKPPSSDKVLACCMIDRAMTKKLVETIFREKEYLANLLEMYILSNRELEKSILCEAYSACARIEDFLHMITDKEYVEKNKALIDQIPKAQRDRTKIVLPEKDGMMLNAAVAMKSNLFVELNLLGIHTAFQAA